MKKTEIITLVNNKGGVAKTSSTAHISALLAQLGYNVLMIDHDPQGNLTRHFKSHIDNNVSYFLYDTYKEYAHNKKAKLPTEMINNNLILIPSSPKLESMRMELVAYNNNQKILSKLLKQFDGFFDYILIDCPPSLCILTANAINACNKVLIPIEGSAFSFDGVDNLLKYLKDLSTDNDLEFELMGAFITRYDVRENINKDYEKDVEKIFGEKLYKTRIRINTNIKKAQHQGGTVFEFYPKSNAAIDYTQLTKEIVKYYGGQN